MRKHSLTLKEVLDLPPTVDVPTAGAAIGLSPAAARKQVKAGTFPFKVIRAGRLHRVATAEIHRALEIEPAPAGT